MAKRTIAVLAATGNIGKVLCAELLRRGHAVRALGRSRAKMAALETQGATPHVAAFDDAAALTTAFRGADAVFSLIAPSYGEDDFSAWQDRSGEAIASAIRRAGVRRVLDLSSVGAQHASGTGPIAGLHRHEKRLEALGVDVLHLRAAYFMDNHFWAIPTLKAMGFNGSPLKADLVLPQVATADLGRKAAELLDRAEFKGRAVVEFAGPEDLTMTEATAALGRAIGRPDLAYVRFPYEDAEKAMIASGMKPGTARLMIEMYRGINDGRVAFEAPVRERGTTTIEEFATGFAGAYKAG
jgi:uncharacterized protein YbjT (DUF2867 family)